MKESEPGRPRRRAVSAESWHQGETILHTLTAAVTFLSPDHRVIWMNQRGLKILGLSPREIEGALCFEIWQNRSIPCPNCPLNEVVRSGQTKEVELTTADSRVWNVRSHPVFDDRGQVAGVVEVRQEITERKKMELAWKESEERFQALFERSLLCVYIHDLGGRFLRLMRQLCNFWAFPGKNWPRLPGPLFSTKNNCLWHSKCLTNYCRQGVSESLASLGSAPRVAARFGLKLRLASFHARKVYPSSLAWLMISAIGKKWRRSY